jgi:uncharacterized protein with von Willebrand factor type A (vWA) domain
MPVSRGSSKRRSLLHFDFCILNCVMALVSNVVLFARMLRDAGISVSAERIGDAVEALQWIDVGARDEVYHTLRTLLVFRREQIPRFDRVFDAFWRADHGDALAPKSGATREGGAPMDDMRAQRLSLAMVAAGDALSDEAAVHGLWSEAGGLADKDFARFTSDELALARTAISRLEWTPGIRRTRRWIPGSGPRIDLRRALARSRRTGGELLTLPRRRRRIRPRTLVLLCDVSGSMERYSRMLLHFAHAIGEHHVRFEAFLFSTGLTRITSQLRTRRIDAAVTAIARTMSDWSGGTRIGPALREFHQRWGRTALAGGPVVLLVSDGWDRGDPEVLRDEIARLQRSSHRLIWLNPLIGTEKYAPLTRGLQAALPFVDEFLPVRTLRNLVDLADHLNALTRRDRALPARLNGKSTTAYSRIAGMRPPPPRGR